MEDLMLLKSYCHNHQKKKNVKKNTCNDESPPTDGDTPDSEDRQYVVSLSCVER